MRDTLEPKDTCLCAHGPTRNTAFKVVYEKDGPRYSTAVLHTMLSTQQHAYSLHTTCIGDSSTISTLCRCATIKAMSPLFCSYSPGA
jgi:hypothetical protein